MLSFKSFLLRCTLLLFLTNVFFIKTVFSQQIINLELLKYYDYTELNDLASSLGLPSSIAPVEYELGYYKLTYTTTDQHGQPTFATGGLVIPANASCPLPIASYQHGTESRKASVPSNFSDEYQIGIIYGMGGMVVAMPDYLGMGDSPGLHPYMHAHTQATATADMLLAMQELEDSLYTSNEQLFLFGYSQGGHATMAAHRYIQDELQSTLNVTASAPMSGPYDVSGIQADLIASDDPYPTPSYLPYIILSYQSVYGNLYNDLSDIFIAPYDSMIPIWFDGTYSTGYINQQLPSVPKDIIKPSVIDDYETDSLNHPLRLALKDNDVTDWVPQSPVRMIYCEADDQVSYLNAIVALDKFTALGATEVEAVSAGASFNHGQCVQTALINAKLYFDNYIEREKAPLIEFDIVQNPDGNQNGIVELITNNDVNFTVEWSDGNQSAYRDDLGIGNYEVSLFFENGCIVNKTLTLPFSSTANTAKVKNIRISPNPAQNSIFINSGEVGFNVVTIHDLQGKIVKRETFSNTKDFHVNVSDLTKGLYLIHLQNTESVYTEKLIIID